MLGLPSPATLRHAAVASVAGAGIALMGVSFANVASIDGTLSAAATQQAVPAPAPIERTQVSFRDVRDCHRDRPHQADRREPASSAADLQY